MSGRKPNILLLCNSRMAVPSLQYLQQDGFLAAIAVPDLHDFVHEPFRALAIDAAIPFTTLHKASYTTQVAQLLQVHQSDAVFVIGFPWKIPATLLGIPVHGFLNFHGGLLPEMRGRDPLFESIRQRKPQTGLTVHQMDAGLDTGPVIRREILELSPETTHGMLSSHIAFACEKVCREIVPMMADNMPLEATPQDETLAMYWPEPDKASLTIDWQTMDSLDIKALIKACNPLLKGALTRLEHWTFGITDVTDLNLDGDTSQLEPGRILYADPQQGLIIYCKDKRALRLDVVYTDEGYFPGYKLAQLGLRPGLLLGNTVPALTTQFS